MSKIQPYTKKLQYIFDNSKVGIAIFNTDDNCLEMVNPAFAHIHGYEPHELIGTSPGEVFAPECMLELEAQEKTPSYANGDISFETMHYKKDGSPIDVFVQITVIRDENGKVKHHIANIQDITEKKQQEKLLQKREQEFRSLAENAQDTIYRYDRNCRRIYVNPAVERISGKSASILLGKMPTEEKLVASDESLKVLKSLKHVLKTGQKDEIEVIFSKPDGSKCYYRHNHVPEYATDGSVIGVLSIGHDITAQKKLQNDLFKREYMFRTLAENSPNIIMRYDLNCRRIYVNPAYAHQTGIPQDRAICEKPETQWDKYLNMLNTTAIDYQNKLTDVMKSGKSDSLYVEWVRLSDGEYVAHDLNVVAEYDEYENITGALVIGHNITKRKVIEKKVEHMAHHDALTNLPNRILAKARAEQAIESAKRDNSKMALLFIDLDGFKTINDSMGHTMGDEVLKIVASRIMNEIEENDTVCRQGGDEFLIILPDINSMKKVVVFIENLLSKFEKVFYVGDHAISTSASIGIAIYPDNGDSFESLLQNADVAMYKAKENGKNTYSFYTKQMNQNNTKQFKIQNDLKKAISNNEFVVYYQPQIDLAKNHIVGVEALIRWQHPELGMIPPMSFIPIAESSGLIITIGEWVLKEACRQAAIWSKHGIILTVAVNISAVQFKRGNLEEIVKKALSYSGLDPRFLELELTESIMINDVENVLTTVKALKALGVQLSIDDFGTGYSSLAYLKRFAIDKLKIDQSFIRDILNDKEDAAIVKTIIQMAKNLNLKTIAEGVENKQVLDLVSAFGCDEVQGYHFAKPMPVTQFKKYQREFISKKLQGI